MKKIILFILTLSMLCTVVPCGALGYSDVTDLEAVDVITGIGIMEGYSDGTFLPDNNITRAEFADVVAGIYTYGSENDGTSEWKSKYFTDIYSGTELIPLEEMQKDEVGIFSDVPQSSWAYNSIKLVSELGFMEGVGGGRFGADDNLTIEQALKVIVTMMGYRFEADKKGGYPSGYVTVAGELGLTDSVGESSAYAKRKEIAQIVYDAFDVEVVQNVRENGKWGQRTKEGETFLLKVVGLSSGRGRMTDNGYTNLLSSKVPVLNQVVINNKNFTLNTNGEMFRSLLGRDVDYYYYTTDDGENILVYARLSGQDTVYEIDIEDFKDYSNNKIYYSDDTRDREISLVKAPYFIKNKTAVKDFDKTDFDCNYGKITVVKSRGSSDADLIILQSYQNFNIEYVDVAAEVMYSTASVLGKQLDLDSNNNTVKIYNPQGELIGLDAVVAGNIASVCKGDGIIEIYISDNVVSDFKIAVMSTNEEGEIVYESTNGQKVILSKDYTDVNPDNLPKLGSVYEFNIDILGRAVKFKKQSSEYEVGFMSDVRLVGEPDYDNIRIKYYDMTARQLVTGFCADNVKLTDTEDNIKGYVLEKDINGLYTKLNDYTYSLVDNVSEKTGGLFRYKTNDDGEIIEIELAGTYENSSDNSSRLVEIKLVNNSESLNFYNGKGLIGGTVIINGNTQILQCNFRSDKFNDTKGYSIVSRSVYSENKKFAKDETKFYSTVRNSPVAEFMVENTNPSQSISAENHTVGIVTNMYTGLNDDNEAATFVEFDSKSYEVDKDAIGPGNVTNMQGDTSYQSPDGQTHYFDVEKGDIIRYALGSGGEISGIQLLYDANADYSSGLTINGVNYDGWSKQGNLAGCIDGYNKDVYKYSNPFSVTNGSNGNSFASDPYTWSYYNGNMRVMLGTLLRNGNGYMITTTRNLPENPGEVSYAGDGVYATNTYSASSATLVTVSDRYVKVELIPVASLRSYELAGEGCDRVLITSRLGVVRNLIVYRYE